MNIQIKMAVSSMYITALWAESERSNNIVCSLAHTVCLISLNDLYAPCHISTYWTIAPRNALWIIGTSNIHHEINTSHKCTTWSATHAIILATQYLEIFKKICIGQAKNVYLEVKMCIFQRQKCVFWGKNVYFEKKCYLTGQKYSYHWYIVIITNKSCNLLIYTRGVTSWVKKRNLLT